MTTTAYPNNHLSGHGLRLAQAVWVVITITATGMFLVGIPFALSAFSRVGSFLTPETMAALQRQGISPQQYAQFTVASLSVSGLIWVTVGVIIFARKSADAFALIVSLALVVFGTQTTLRGSLVEAVPALSLPGQILTTISWVLIALFFALFPNGRFVPNWIRWFVLIWVILISLPPQIAVPDLVGGIAFFVFWAISLSAQVYRYFRVSKPVERQQTKWVLFAFVVLQIIYMPLFALYFINSVIVNSPQVLLFGNIFPVIIPISIGIAILRAQLFDVDIIIRKTLVYTVLSGLLALVYFGMVVLLQSVFDLVSGQQSPIVIVISTLIIAALFAPLRQRVQAVIDRRFYRQKYDAQQVLAQFAVVARDETDMDKLTAELVRVVQETMQPESVILWLKPVKSR